jgi:hypothetical protein
MEWNAKRNVINTIVECGGKVFGGAVRDTILHNKNAARFYEAFEKEHACKPTLVEYADETCFPEYANRCVIPVDIDATIEADKVDKLITALVNKNFSIRRRFSRDAKSYLPSLEVAEGDVKHNRYLITPIRPQLASIMTREFLNNIPLVLHSQIKHRQEIQELMTKLVNETIGTAPAAFVLDLMVTSPECTKEAPFGALDFECNGLVIDKNGIRMSECLSEGIFESVAKWDKTCDIIKDIIERRAVWCGSFAQEYRIKHMHAKGWTIGGFHFIKCVKEKYDGYCLICHDECDEKHYKRTCCDARYHARCLVNVLGRPRTRHECPMCKQIVSNDVKINSDFTLLRSLTDVEEDDESP